VHDQLVRALLRFRRNTRPGLYAPIVAILAAQGRNYVSGLWRRWASETAGLAR